MSIILFLIWPVIFLSTLSTILLPLQSKADDATSASNVLGRTVRLDALCDDFEDVDWNYDYQKRLCYRGFWRGADRGEPELLKRIGTPAGGKHASTGALEIRTIDNKDDNFPNQEDFITVEFKKILGRNLIRADQPVFIVRVWLPPFDQWTKDHNNFGFRAAPRSKKISEYYPSIWLFYNNRAIRRVEPSPLFVFRIGTGVAGDEVGGPIKQPGWWTLALAFDKKGVGYYYARPGVGLPTEKHRMFDTTLFRTIDGSDNPTMDHVGYTFFSLGYPVDDRISPRFVIDDYEVWVINREKMGSCLDQ